MKSLKLIASFMMAAVVLLAFNNPEKTTAYNVDIKQSDVQWTGRKVGGEHTGKIKIKEGSLDMEGNKLIGGNFAIDMTTIENEDLSGEYKAKLEGHLKSDDFFGVATYPTASFVITQAKAKSGSEYEVTGNLTIKDITHEITFPATINTSGNQVTADAKIVVDRANYNVRYGSDSFFDNLGDKVIYDDFDLEVSLVAATAVGK